jgi:biopolymer transport protein ExbD
MEFRRPKRRNLPLSNAAMVDIVFLLLIFFLLSSSFQNPAIQLALPEAKNEIVPEKQPITVSLDREGRLFINQDEISLDVFPERLKLLMGQLHTYEVIFRGDKSIRYDQLMKIMTLARQAGAEYFDLSHLSEP